MNITIAQAFTLMTSQGHGLFGAVWTKKNGDLRTGSLRLRVTKGVTGAGLSYDPAAHGLLCAFDMNKENPKTGEKGAFLMLNLKGLQSIKVDGTTYNVRH
jgi:hypothetical protein